MKLPTGSKRWLILKQSDIKKFLNGNEEEMHCFLKYQAEGKERDRAHKFNMKKIVLQFKRGGPSRPQDCNQDCQMSNSPYVRPQLSSLLNPLLTPPTEIENTESV